MAKPVVGQEVCIAHYGNWNTTYQFGYTVKKVTPAGRVTVARDSDGHERVFKPNGSEMGKHGYDRDRLEFDVAGIKASEARNAALSNVARAIGDIKGSERANHRWGADGLQQEIDRLKVLVYEAEKLLAAVQ